MNIKLTDVWASQNFQVIRTDDQDQVETTWETVQP